MVSVKKIYEVCMLLTVYPVVCCILVIDRWLPKNYLCSIPRSVAEIHEHPAWLLQLIKQGTTHTVPQEAVFVSLDSEGGSEAEPDKNASVLKGRLTYSVKGSTSTISIFVKIPTARKVDIWIKALGSVFASDHKEIAFYNRAVPYFQKVLGKEFPATVPVSLFAKWDRLFDRAIIICEVIDTNVYKPIPDWKGLSHRQIIAQVSCSAAIHGATWNTKGFSYIRERKGTDWLNTIFAVFSGKLNEWQLEIWKGISQRCVTEPVVFSHGDCRAGNMLFKDTTDATEVIMTDWEANAVTPFMWDCTYAIVCGLSVKDRRAHRDSIVKHYLRELQTQLTKNRIDGTLKRGGTDETSLEVPSFEAAMKLYNMMVICIWYFGWILGEVGGVGKTQGNTDNDMDAWTERLTTACLEAIEEEATFAKDIGVSVDVLLKFRDKLKSDLQK